MTKHTPGPWNLESSARSDKLTLYAKGGLWVELRGIKIEDARLIASAPELLALLKEMQSVWKEGITCRFEPGCTYSIKVNEAIAKAEGRK